MKVRQYKYVHTEIVEEERVPQKRRRTIVPVPLRPLKSAPQQYNLEPPQPIPTQPQPGRLPPLVLKSLPLAVLSVVSILMMTVLVCALFGLFTWPTPEENVALARRPVLIGAHLSTFTPTPVGGAVAQVVATPTPTVGNAVVPSDAPTATPPSLPTPAGAYTAPPSAAGNQNNSQPTLTSRVTLNVRSGPGLDNSVVGKLAVGQSARITGQNPDGSWWQIEYPSGSGRQAWVSANPQYSTVSQTMPQVIAQAPTPTSQPVAAAVTATPPPPVGVPPTPRPPTPAAGETKGWTFTATRADAIPARKMLMLFGEMTNETGTAQQISTITGTFYDAQGQVLAADKSTYGLWPTNIVPPGGRVPFALTVYDIQEAGNFELAVQSKPVEAAPRQDFEFLEVNEQMKGNNYCLAGALKNPGSALEKQLVIAAVLYDDQGNVLRFGNNNKVAYQGIVGDQTTTFEVCIKSPPENMASHDLLAWGI